MLRADASFLTFVPVNYFTECCTYIYNLTRECNSLYNLTAIFQSSASTHISSTTPHYNFWLLPWRVKKWMIKDKLTYFNHQFVLFLQRTTISSSFFPFSLRIAHSIFPYYTLCIAFQWNTFVEVLCQFHYIYLYDLLISYGLVQATRSSDSDTQQLLRTISYRYSMFLTDQSSRTVV